MPLFNKLFETTEHELQNLIISHLNIAGHFVWRNNSGLFKKNYTTKAGINKSSFIRASIKGASDIIGIAQDGKMIAIEVKKKPNKPDVLQLEFLNKIKERGGYACVAYTLDDALELFL